MQTLWKRTNEPPKNWRCVYKGLQLLEYLIAYGSEHCVDDAINNIGRLKILSNFSHVEEVQGKKTDYGESVRNIAAKLLKLLGDKKAIEDVRARAEKGDFDPYSRKNEPNYNSFAKGDNRSSSVADFQNIDTIDVSIYTPPKSMRTPVKRAPRKTEEGENRSGNLSNSSSYSDFGEAQNNNEELSKLKQQVETWKLREQEQRQRAEDLQNQIHSMQDELHNIKKPIESTVKSYVKPEFQDPRLSVTREQRLQIQVDRQAQEIRKLDTERSEALQKLQQAQRGLQNSDQKRQYAEEQLKTIKDELNQVLEKKTKELKGEKDQLEQRQKQESELLRVKIASLESESKEAKRQADDLRNQLEEERNSRGRDKQDGEQKNNELIDRLQKLGDEKSDLQQRVDRAEKEKEEAELKISQLSRSLGEERVTLSVTREQVEALTQGLQTAVAENTNLATTLNESKVALENSIKEITDLREQLRSSKQESTKALQEAKTLLQKVEAELNEKKRLETQLQQVRDELNQSRTALSTKDQTFGSVISQFEQQRIEQNKQFSELLARVQKDLAEKKS